jgi:hypothetical protein
MNTAVENIQNELKVFRDKLLKAITEKTVSEWEVNDLDTLIYKIEIEHKSKEKEQIIFAHNAGQCYHLPGYSHTVSETYFDKIFKQ